MHWMMSEKAQDLWGKPGRKKLHLVITLVKDLRDELGGNVEGNFGSVHSACLERSDEYFGKEDLGKKYPRSSNARCPWTQKR